MNLKDIGISYGDSPATMYPAQIVLPCAQDQAARHEETIAEIPVKYRAQVAKGNHPEVYLRSLPDWKYRKWTCSSHVILRERSTMVAILETIAASKEDWEQLIKDQWNEIEDKSWFADDSFTTGLGIYGFSLSVLHAEILERTCEFPTLTQGLRAQDMLTVQAARKRDTVALAELEELMRVMITGRDARTNVTRWLLRIKPRIVLKHEMFARWIVGVMPHYWISYMREKAKEGACSNLPFLAYIVPIKTGTSAGAAISRSRCLIRAVRTRKFLTTT